MPGYRLRFGAYDLPTTLLPVDDGGGEDIQATDLPRRSGASTQEGRERSRTLVIRGQLHADTFDAWFTALDTLLASCSGTADLWYGRDDRYFKDAQLESWGRSDPAEGRLWGIIASVSLQFVAARHVQPFGTATYTPALTAAGGTVTYSAAQGSADTYPLWTITIADAGTGVLTLTNTTTGEVCTVAVPGANFAAGDILTLDRLTGQGKRNGALLPGLYDRRIPRLVPGSNTITLASGGTATIASLAVSYPGRFKR